MSDFIKRNIAIVIATLFVAVVFVVVPLVVTFDEADWPPSLGDWGDYIGGAMALIVFIWLIAAHFENQRQIAGTNRDMETQLELTREVVGAIATIAAGTKVQATEVLADAAPLFVYLSALGGQTGRHTAAAVPTHGYFSFRNEGSLARITSVQVNHPDVSCQFEGNKLCGTGGVFKLHVSSKIPLRDAWPMEMTVAHVNKFEIAGWAKITAKSFGAAPEIEHGEGRDAD